MWCWRKLKSRESLREFCSTSSLLRPLVFFLQEEKIKIKPQEYKKREKRESELDTHMHTINTSCVHICIMHTHNFSLWRTRECELAGNTEVRRWIREVCMYFEGKKYDGGYGAIIFSWNVFATVAPFLHKLFYVCGEEKNKKCYLFSPLSPLKENVWSCSTTLFIEIVTMKMARRKDEEVGENMEWNELLYFSLSWTVSIILKKSLVWKWKSRSRAYTAMIMNGWILETGEKVSHEETDFIPTKNNLLRTWPTKITSLY